LSCSVFDFLPPRYSKESSDFISTVRKLSARFSPLQLSCFHLLLLIIVSLFLPKICLLIILGLYNANNINPCIEKIFARPKETDGRNPNVKIVVCIRFIDSTLLCHHFSYTECCLVTHYFL